MGEQFRGNGYAVHFSGGATYELFRALLTLGARMEPTPATEATLRFLRGRVRAAGERARAFDLAPPPDELDEPGRLATLAKLLAAFARELAAAEPDPELTDISWDRKLRLDWLARVLDLRRLVLEAGAVTALAPEPDLALSDQDQREVELRRLLARKEDLVSATRTSDNPRGDVREVDPDRLLPLLDRIVEIAQKIEPEGRRMRLLADQHFDRGTALLERGDRPRAAHAFRVAASAETDDELREKLLAYVQDLEDPS